MPSSICSGHQPRRWCAWPQLAIGLSSLSYQHRYIPCIISHLNAIIASSTKQSPLPRSPPSTQWSQTDPSCRTSSTHQPRHLRSRPWLPTPDRQMHSTAARLATSRADPAFGSPSAAGSSGPIPTLTPSPTDLFRRATAILRSLHTRAGLAFRSRLRVGFRLCRAGKQFCP